MTETKDLVETDQDIDKISRLVVFNDNVNTFAWVIETLIEICKHTPNQAEQCAWIIHYRGRCTVKTGEEVELIPLKQAINERGINAKIET